MNRNNTYSVKCAIARDLRAGIEVKVIARSYQRTERFVEIIKKQITKDPSSYGVNR